MMHYPRLITEVEQEKRGTFRSLREQPLIKAAMIPSGGLGGIVLIDYFLKQAV